MPRFEVPRLGCTLVCAYNATSRAQAKMTVGIKRERERKRETHREVSEATEQLNKKGLGIPNVGKAQRRGGRGGGRVIAAQGNLSYPQKNNKRSNNNKAQEQRLREREKEEERKTAASGMPSLLYLSGNRGVL
ncbi:hypothetical protein HPP92_025573 [Vanilla planifolia]|uniref:Uncharacterized protein n=1 Tax=Vanilla planifolia TaxID=51239 RepID=A0A835PJH2_VANPL|nr:hypothetical protein HPP92_025573 [Vanilla planifolia]